MPFDSASPRHTPMPHQETGATFLAMRGFAMLCDEPGLGKTLQSILACDYAGARKVLVVCPAVVRRMWEDEFLVNQQIDRLVRACEGNPKDAPGDGVTIVSHAAFADEAAVATLRQGAPYDVIILDESHQIRQMDAARCRNLLAPGGAWTWAKHFWCLTGTPIVNSAADVWPLFYGPLQDPLSWWDFGVRYAEVMKQDAYGGIRPIGLQRQDELAKYLRPHMLRRTLESVGILLPPLTVEQRAVEVPPAVLTRIMSDLDNWTQERLDLALEEKDELHDSALARVRKALGLAKAEAVARYVHDMLLAREGPVVVFFQHTAVREELFNMLSRQCGWKVSWIDGKVTLPQLKAAKEWFQAGRLDVVLVQTDAGGVGISLTRSNRVVIGELPWTAVALWQGVKRCHRIGTTRPVLAEVMRARGCWLDEALAGTISKKDLAAHKLLSLLETNQ